MTIQADPLNLIVCGVGGQGNILIARMIGRILSNKGYCITIGETFGAAQRGGAVHSSMRISRKRYYGPLIPRGKAHVVVSLEPLETLRILSQYGNDNVITVTNSHPVHPVGVVSGRAEYPDLAELQRAIGRLSRAAWMINVTEMALRMNAPIAANIILLGSLLATNQMPLEVEEVEEQIRETLPEAVVDLNLRALTAGRAAMLSMGQAPHLERA